MIHLLQQTLVGPSRMLPLPLSDHAPVFFHHLNICRGQPGRDVDLAVRNALVDFQLGNWSTIDEHEK